jgi:2-polyprenyl-6-methoxyphenol hydroxylase-like FAD-dependent oxidoreductase
VTAGWHHDLRDVIQRTDPDNTSLLALRTFRPGQRWTLGRATLIGDAAHAAAPTTGNGANTALHDAKILSQHLISVAQGRASIADALENCESQMMAYGRAAVDESLTLLRPFQ